jgi:hypothetical protein
MSEPGVPTYFEWVVQNLKEGMKIGFDPSQMSTGNTQIVNFSL